MSNLYLVKLDQFEGPLDLLLHLIKESELDIFSIDLLVLTSQYLDFLRLMKFRDLKEASAFIEMAASLIEIKSTELLPSNATEGKLDDEALGDEGPSLTQRLMVYEVFRKAAEHFAVTLHRDDYTCTNHEWDVLAKDMEHIEAPIRGDAPTLLVLYEQLLTTLSDRRPVTVTAVTETITVDEVIDRLQVHIQEMRFSMFQGLYQKIPTRYELVAHVLGMLQLVRDRSMKIYQEQGFGPIWMYRMDLEEQDFLKIKGEALQ